MGRIRSKRSVLAYVFCLLMTVGTFTPSAQGIPLSYNDKKIGAWVGLAEKTIPPATYVQNVFNKVPYYSVLFIQTGVDSTTEGVDWTKNVGIEASKLNKPEIEIGVGYGFNYNVRSETNWVAFQSVVQNLKAGQPAIKYIGAEAEFWCAPDHGCAGLSDPETKAMLDRIKSVIEPEGFSLLNWFIQSDSFAPNDPNYPIIAGTTFPTWGDPAYVLNWFQQANYVGYGIGVAANTACCGPGYDSWLVDKENSACGCYWTQELVNMVIDKWHSQPTANRHFNLLIGPMVDPATARGRDLAYYWNDDFRNWVWQRQQLYSEFTWVGKTSTEPGSPRSYLDFAFLNASQSPVWLPELTWKLFNGTEEIAYTPGTYALDSYKTYVLKTYYAGYLMKENQVSILNQTVDVRLSLFQHGMVPRGQIAFDKPLSTFALLQENNDLLTFTSDSSFTGHLIVIKSPRAPHYVLKDGVSYSNWSFDLGSNATVITTQTLGSWAISFAAASPPPPQPPPPIFLPRELFPYNLLTIGFVIGLLPFILAFFARRRNMRYKIPCSA